MILLIKVESVDGKGLIYLNGGGGGAEILDVDWLGFCSV